TCQRFHREPMAIADEARAALEAYPWPGNIRQLENVIQNAVLFATGGKLLLRHLAQPIQEHALSGQNAALGRPADGSLSLQGDIHERSVIHKTLADCEYTCSKAARVLKVSRATLYRKMRKYGFEKLYEE